MSREFETDLLAHLRSYAAEALPFKVFHCHSCAACGLMKGRHRDRPRRGACSKFLPFEILRYST